MALIYIDDLREGMILADDLLTPRGRFVLAAGATLQAEHLRHLKSWGVIEADIDEASLGAEYQQQQERLNVFLERAEGHLWRRFALNDPHNEPMATLYRHVLHRFAESLQQGWDPVAFADAALPAADDAAPPPLSVPQLLKGDIDIVSQPTVYAHIVELLEHPHTSTPQIARVISKDASLTVRLLRLVNSPLYGFSGKIDSVSRAVSLIGTNELTTLALGITVVSQFASIPSTLLNMDSFWRHSIRCGLFARFLAEYLDGESAEKYFTGGLLHDMGRLVMLERMPRQYSGAIARARAEHLPMYRAEQDKLQTDHTIVGKMLAQKWRLPPALVRMIGGHHSPRLAHYSREACLLHIADVLAHACGHEALLVNEIPPLQLEAWQETGLGEEVIAPTIRKVDAEFKAIVRVFFGGADTEDAARESAAKNSLS